MKIRVLLSIVLLLTALLANSLAAPQAEAGRCWIAGSARRHICVCVINGRPDNVPMSLCGRRR